MSQHQKVSETTLQAEVSQTHHQEEVSRSAQEAVTLAHVTHREEVSQTGEVSSEQMYSQEEIAEVTAMLDEAVAGGGHVKSAAVKPNSLNLSGGGGGMTTRDGNL